MRSPKEARSKYYLDPEKDILASQRQRATLTYVQNRPLDSAHCQYVQVFNVQRSAVNADANPP